MSFANEVIKKLFGRPESDKDSTKLEPFILDSGQIKRSSKELENFQAWKTDHASDFFFELKQNALFSQQNLTERLSFVWLNTSTANGFQFNLSALKTPIDESWYALELIKERIIDQGYIATHSEFTISEMKHQLHKKEWFYLKTPHQMRIGKPPFEQRFGNIQLEMNEKTKTTLKLTATTYSDRNYNPPLPFEDLVDAIFY